MACIGSEYELQKIGMWVKFGKSLNYNSNYYNNNYFTVSSQLTLICDT